LKPRVLSFQVDYVYVAIERSLKSIIFSGREEPLQLMAAGA